MKKAQIKPAKIIYFYYAVIYYFCISIVLLAQIKPAKRDIASLLLFLFFLAIFFVFMTKGFLVTPPRKRRLRNVNKRKAMTEYGFCIKLALCSSMLFLLSILTYIFVTDKTVSFLSLLSSTALLYICSAVFLSENHAYTQHYKILVSWIVKIGWVAGSFYAYALARHDFMNIADLAYDQTTSRFFVILYAGLIVMAYISLAVTSAGLFFYKFEDTNLTVNKKEVRIIRESFPLFIPLSMTAIISILIFILNTKLIFNTALNISIPVDTTDTFKCNDTSMVLGSEGDHYYLPVDKGEYRVFTYKHDDWYVSALHCRKEKPYFILTDIKSKKEIISDNFSGIIKNARDNFDAIAAQ